MKNGTPYTVNRSENPGNSPFSKVLNGSLELPIEQLPAFPPIIWQFLAAADL